MKIIKPISIWDKGTTHQAEILNAYGTFTQLGKNAQFYYQLFAKKENSMVQVAEGNVTMSEEEYANWGDDDDYVWEFVAKKLNLEIIGDYEEKFHQLEPSVEQKTILTESSDEQAG